MTVVLCDRCGASSAEGHVMTAFSIPDQIGVPKMLDLCDVCLTALKEWVKPA